MEIAVFLWMYNFFFRKYTKLVGYMYLCPHKPQNNNIMRVFFFWLYLIGLIAGIWTTRLLAQNTTVAAPTPPTKVFKIEAELRSRTELRNGYRQLRNDTTTVAFFTGGRTRIGFNYQTPKYALVMSAQDVRVWGETDGRSNKSLFQLFEGYGDYFFSKRLSLRAGRQRLMYDNQRLFAQNDWRHTANAHDGFNLRYIAPKLKTELAVCFNQKAEQFFGTNFNPDFSTYKFLAVHYLLWSINKQWTLTTINATDGFQDVQQVEKIHFRHTNGGRIELTQQKWYATLAAYYQWGKTVADQNIMAYYLQPEVKYMPNNKWWVRLGAEVMSGQDALHTTDTKFRSFVALYGVAHRFNGYMDLFTAFPADLNYAGLVNPYLFVNYSINEKWALRSDYHVFYSQNNFVQNGVTIKRYLGFENDWLLNYALNDATKIEWGVSYFLPTESLTYIKKGGNAGLLNYWGYVQLTFKPTLFQHSSTVQ